MSTQLETTPWNLKVWVWTKFVPVGSHRWSSMRVFVRPQFMISWSHVLGFSLSTYVPVLQLTLLNRLFALTGDFFLWNIKIPRIATRCGMDFYTSSFWWTYFEVCTRKLISWTGAAAGFLQSLRNSTKFGISAGAECKLPFKTENMVWKATHSIKISETRGRF